MKRPVYKRAAIRLMVATVVLWVGALPLSAGTIPGAETDSPNNEDFKGVLEENPNFLLSDVGRVNRFDRVFTVVDSGGTTEYALVLRGCVFPLVSLYELRIGFGRGESFVPATEVLEGLTFDAPDFDPAPTSVPFWMGGPSFTLIRAASDTLLWQGGNTTGDGRFLVDHQCFDVFRISVDVPDLPDSVMDFYSPFDLPEDSPAGAKAFTIRGRYVDEPSEPLAIEFRRGDVDADGNLNITDAVFVLDHLFGGGHAPACAKSADADDSGTVDVTDAVYLLNFLFTGGSPPAAPHNECGRDPTVDDLSCVTTC